MMLPSATEQLTRTAFFLLVLSSVVLNLSCGKSGGPSTNGTVNPNTGNAADKKSPRIKLLSSIVKIRPAGGSEAPLETLSRELKNGDSITADDNGEAAIQLNSCDTIYIYRNSYLTKDSCPKFDKQSGNYYCTVEGTAAFQDCANNIITQSDSATVALVGTRASHTYIKEMELALVLLFEGRGEARPVTDKREHLLGEAKTIPAQHFWFTVPNNRLNEARALNIGLEPREVYPFSKLPQLLAKLPNLNLDSVAQQAIDDGVLPPGSIIIFRPLHPPVAGNGNGDSHNPTGPGAGGERLQGTTAYGFTKIGRPATREFSTLNHAVLQQGSARITSGVESFRVVPTSMRSDMFAVEFAPPSLGAHAGVLKFIDKSGRRYTYQLSGTGASSGMSVSSDHVSFNGTNPRVDRLLVKSTGDVALEVSEISLLEDPDKRFKIQSTTCKDPLDKDKQCEVTIEHNRVAANISQTVRDMALLSIANDSAAKPMFVRVSAPVLPELEVAETLMFGPVVIPATCDKPLLIKNNSDKSIKMGAAVVKKGDGFSVEEDTCSNAVLAPGGSSSCSVKVKFEPWIEVQNESELTLPYTSSSGTVSRTVKLSGKGEAAQFNFRTNGSFGSVELGATEKTATISIEPLRKPVTKIERVGLTGAAMEDYEIRSETCTKAAVGEKCEVRIAFKPKAEGRRDAELVVVAKAEDTVTRYPLKGDAYLHPASLRSDPVSVKDDSSCGREFRVVIEGNAYAPSRIREKNPVCFGAKSVIKGTDPKPRILQLHLESESRDRPIPSYSITGDGHEDFEVISKKCNDSPKSCVFNIEFKPKATNKRRAVMSIAPDANTPPTEVELHGRGKSPNPFKRFGRWVVGLFIDEAAKACQP